MSADVDDARFAENLRRYYDGAEPAAELHASWRRVCADDRALAALESRLRQDEPPVAGLAWWEERTGPSALDRINWWLSTEPTLRVRPRGHRPASLIGAWRWSAWSDDGVQFGEAPARQWRLHGDGRVEVRGTDPDGVDGASWRVHHAAPDELWLMRPGDVHPRRWSWWLDGGTLEVRPPGALRARGRLTKMDEAP